MSVDPVALCWLYAACLFGASVCSAALWDHTQDVNGISHEEGTNRNSGKQCIACVGSLRDGLKYKSLPDTPVDWRTLRGVPMPPVVPTFEVGAQLFSAYLSLFSVRQLTNVGTPQCS